MYKIGLFSKISKTTIKTLRYYDEVGLLKPAMIDEDNGYRYYTSDQLSQLHDIIALRQLSFSVDDCIQIIRVGEIDEVLGDRKKEIETNLNELQDRLSRLNHYISEIKEGRKMTYSPVIKQTPECIIYSKRMIVPNYDSYFQIIPKIGEEVTATNPDLKCAIPEYCFIIYHDGEYKDHDIDVEYCEAVDEFGQDTDSIKFKKIPSITVVSVMHKGVYSGLRDAYAYAFRWIEDNNYTITDNPRESYIDGIWNKENQEEWLTELQIPVTKK
ncbi:MAG: MerR family transcriptional regulator [Fusobacteria bacterium]|nr:MAG: MerR family transcriptional regulator [Fusobacteriota bacterium]KAF0229076.1 MAG: MerR family transcriptional [Fusobacteriota bacterium]